MQVLPNKVVSLSYVLKLDNANGEVIEVADDTNPLVFLFGAGDMIPRFEEHLATLEKGDIFEFTLGSHEAYGEYDLDAIIEINKDLFRIDGKIEDGLLDIGNIIPMQDNEGNVLQGKVVSSDLTSVRMDFNHPMAGKTLHFKGNIVDVRDATEDELNHGHVHGEGGHHH
jgi:FKBP-type peptidyl-prolyl cis-trans isomerase SlyD